jgi:CRP-like cAMP-binding protein
MSILTKASLFSEISEGTLRQINAIGESKSYLPGTTIFHEGDPATHLYVLQEGRVRLRMGEGGQLAYVLSTPGEIFGWASMANLEEYTLSVQCVLPVRAVRFENGTLLRILESDPPSGLLFFRHLSELIGQRLINSYQATVSVHGEKSSLSYG